MLRLTTDLTADTVRIHAPSTSQFAVNIAKLVWPSNQVFWRPGAVVLVPLARWRDAVAGVPLLPAQVFLVGAIGPAVERAVRRLSSSICCWTEMALWC